MNNMEEDKIEKEIIDVIINKIDVDKVPSQNELNIMISQEINKRPHLKENWQTFYIEKRIRNTLKDLISPKSNKKKSQGKILVIMAIILFPLVLLPGAMGVLGLFIYIVIMIPAVIYFRARAGKLKK